MAFWTELISSQVDPWRDDNYPLLITWRTVKYPRGTDPFEASIWLMNLSKTIWVIWCPEKYKKDVAIYHYLIKDASEYWWKNVEEGMHLLSGTKVHLICGSRRYGKCFSYQFLLCDFRLPHISFSIRRLVILSKKTVTLQRWHQTAGEKLAQSKLVKENVAFQETKVSAIITTKHTNQEKWKRHKFYYLKMNWT